MRWPEVMLIVVLQAALMVFSDELVMTFGAMTPSESARTPFWPNFFLGVGLIAYMVVILKLYLGFLKSAATEGQTPRQPMELLRIGQPYFIRILVFRLLLEFSVYLLTIPIISYLGGAIWKVQDVSKIPVWFIQLTSLFGMLLLMKPFFLIPARILVYEDTVFQALSVIWNYRLARIEHFVPLALGGFGVVAAATLLNGLATVKTPMYYVLSGIHHLVFSLVFLWLTLIVVLWVQEHLETLQAQAGEGQSKE